MIEPYSDKAKLLRDDFAEREMCELITADDKVRNAQQRFSFVRHLSTLP